MIRKLLLCAALALAGCGGPVVYQSSPTDIISWSDGSTHGEGLQQWLAAARKRFPNPIIVAFHGWDCDGRWTSHPDDPRLAGPIEPVAKALHDAMPDRQIVLLACNPDHQKLHVPGVWYADDSVWIVPGPDWRVVDDDDSMDYAVGNIWEFQEGQP